MSAICGAVGEYDSSTVRNLADSLRKEGQSLDIFEDRGIIIAGVHEGSESNIASDDRGEMHAGVAGDVFIRPHEKSELNYGSRAVANAWAALKESTTGATEGAFVSVIYDSRESKCYAFNDFLGQVPLFYFNFEGATYFASELRPFLQNKYIPVSIDTEGLRFFFSLCCIPGSRSILEGVRKMLPASLIRITSNSVQGRKYWKIGNVRINPSREIKETIDLIESSLLTSVQRRLVFGRRPLCVLLGGMDSSIITALMRRITDEKITAVTASFSDSKYNERGPKQVANENNVDLLEVPVTPEEMPNIIEDMAGAFDEPVSDMVASPVAFALMKKSRGAGRTFFDGTGADILFQGITHGLNKVEYLLNRLPSPLVSRIHNDLSTKRSIREYLPKNSKLLVSPTEKEVVFWQQLSDERVDSLISAHDGTKKKAENNSSNGEIVSPIVSDIALDLRGAKLDPRNITVKTAVSIYFVPTHGFDCSRNRALSSRFQVRIISPFYDRELFDLGLSVPWYYKTPSGGGLSKPLLRKFAIEKGILPKDVALLKKQGLGSSRPNLTDTQMKVWMRGELSNWVSDTITESLSSVKHLLNEEEAMSILRNGKPLQIFEILTFILWYKRYFAHEN